MVCTDTDKLFNGSIVSWRYGSKKVFLVRKTEDSLLNAGFELTLTAGSQVVTLTEGDGSDQGCRQRKQARMVCTNQPHS